MGPAARWRRRQRRKRQHAALLELANEARLAELELRAVLERLAAALVDGWLNKTAADVRSWWLG